MPVQFPLLSSSEQDELIKLIQSKCLRPVFVSAIKALSTFTTSVATGWDATTVSWSTSNVSFIAGIECGLFLTRTNAPDFLPQYPIALQVSYNSGFLAFDWGSNPITSNEGAVIHTQFSNDSEPTNLAQSFLPHGYFLQPGQPVYFHMAANSSLRVADAAATFIFGAVLYVVQTPQKT